MLLGQALGLGKPLLSPSPLDRSYLRLHITTINQSINQSALRFHPCLCCVNFRTFNDCPRIGSSDPDTSMCQTAAWCRYMRESESSVMEYINLQRRIGNTNIGSEDTRIRALWWDKDASTMATDQFLVQRFFSRLFHAPRVEFTD